MIDIENRNVASQRGRRSWREIFCGNLSSGGKKEKRNKKERKGRPVENDAPDGNPTKQDFHSGLQNPSGFAHFPPAPPPAYQRAGFHLKEAGSLSEEWGAPHWNGRFAGDGHVKRQAQRRKIALLVL